MTQILSFDEWKEALVEQYINRTTYDHDEARFYVDSVAMDWIEDDYSEGLSPEESCDNDLENWEPDNSEDDK